MTMEMPEWATEEARREAMKALASYDLPEEFAPVDLVPVTEFSTLFAEWMFKEKDLLLHLFPRAGAEDRWYPASYRDGHYIPARREEKATITFPGDMRDLIKEASDKTWMGNVAIDLVPELGAYAVQFQDAKNTVDLVGPGKFVDKFCEALDALLEGEK